MAKQNKTQSPSLSYRDAGVDIEAGNALVERIKPLAKATNRTGVSGDLGGFGGLFDLAACKYKDPILVSGTDGVGTKLNLAFATGKHDTIGIDLVAMCVNDLVVQGAEPLFFLDYFATGGLEVEVAAQVISGIAEGCRRSGCALIGGETAEMPGMYAKGHYDLAGFAVGAVERDEVLPRLDAIKEGDIILGLPSSGVHSNGYSLVRRVVQKSGLSYADPAPFYPATTLGEALLTPTALYVKPLLNALKKSKGIKALAHITGGGLLENIPRVLPTHLGVALDAGSWTILPVFEWLAKEGNIEPKEMLRTFNCGIGMVVVVSKGDVASVSAALEQEGMKPYTIGEVTPRQGEAVQVAHAERIYG